MDPMPSMWCLCGSFNNLYDKCYRSLYRNAMECDASLETYITNHHLEIRAATYPVKH